MHSPLNDEIFKTNLASFYKEDGLTENFYYLQKLPRKEVTCSLKVKSDLVLAGLPYFFSAFQYLMSRSVDYSEFFSFEGKEIKKEEELNINFLLPFNVALTGERIALNLLHRMSGIATTTRRFVKIADQKKIAILDTRKTTPGLRNLEKYAVRVGGGKNHRFHQTDVWMVKDNHKKYFGGLTQAVNFFKEMGSFYQAMVVEIHNLEELKEASSIGVEHFMLDNFSPDEVREAIKFKKDNQTYEVSGGIDLESIKDYLIEGVDAFSIGMLTSNPVKVDLSLKFNL